ncbi:hypothetical protein [Polaromonas eurypsychrophila]|uniref:hypothetical protein n=1 Tax=Polaromonas eurypsychrophila TaxID=1614635 RepID=UPI00166EEDE9|nr:hypothetical protein [Polaromonas eurypsychrophila]
MAASFPLSAANNIGMAAKKIPLSTVALVFATLLLGGCSVVLTATVSMATQLDRATRSAPAKTLLIFLPGRYANGASQPMCC